MQRIRAAGRVLVGKSSYGSLENWIELANFLGIDAENTPKNALSNATYYACLKTLSEAVGKLPLKILKNDRDGGVVEQYSHPLWSVLHDRPNPYMNSTTFWSQLEFNRNHYGNAYAWIVGFGAKTELYPLEPQRVTVWFDNAMILAKAPALWYIYEAQNGKRYQLHFEEVLHFRNFASDDGLVGKSVRSVLAETIQGNIKAQKLLNKMYDNGFAGKATIQYTGDLSDELQRRFAEGIEKYIKGEYKDSGIEMLIPIPIGAKIDALSNIKLADSQFIELKQYSAIQIASAFGIKPVQVGDYTKSSYASAEAQQLSFLVDTLLFIIKQYEEEINYKLLGGEYYSKFNVDVILRADYRTKVETLKSAVQGTLMKVNEARQKLDLPATPDGDVLICNGNAIKLDQVGIQYQKGGGEN